MEKLQENENEMLFYEFEVWTYVFGSLCWIELLDHQPRGNDFNQA